MYLMIADEADQDGSKEFLVFCAVFFPTDALLKIHLGVEALRSKYGYPPGTSLKSSPGSKPKEVTRENHASIKNDVLELASGTGCKACCYIVPHAIAKGQDNENRLKFGINTILIKFDQFLRECGGEAGIALFDRSQDFNQDAYFKEVFELGIPWSNASRKKLDRVLSIESTSNGHSHLNSITDIVVGAFRFVVNEPEKDIVGTKLLGLLSALMWGVVDKNGELNVRERGICIRPKSIDATQYEADVNALIARLEEYNSRNQNT